MRKVKEDLWLRLELGLGQRQIACSCGMGLGTVHEYLERAAAAGIGWHLRAAALLRDLAMARADGSLRQFLARLSRIDVLVIDD
jgi:hypothetical protein